MTGPRHRPAKIRGRIAGRSRTVAPRPDTNGRRRVPCSPYLSSAPSSAVPACFTSPDRERCKQPVSRRNP
ncbi:hypothetical protein KPATCC21470_0518 [Kitasatospora purpeofusca]